MGGGSGSAGQVLGDGYTVRAAKCSSDEGFDSLGEELTLDVDRFREELKNETYRERVRADFLAGVQHGWTARLLVSEWRPLR